jgi:hypothetical protein
MNGVNATKEQLTAQYPNVFHGLGMEGEYCIQLEDAKPFTLSTPTRVALPLLPKVKDELEWMRKLGVITKPSEGCAGMVVVPKSNGKVRICVDLTKLNESVQRERHILPSVEQLGPSSARGSQGFLETRRSGSVEL